MAEENKQISPVPPQEPPKNPASQEPKPAAQQPQPAAEKPAQPTPQKPATPQPVKPQAVAPNAPKQEEHLSEINRTFKEKDTLRRAREMGLEYINIVAAPINPDLLHLINREKAQEALVLPFYRLGKNLRIAVADPQKPEVKSIMESLQKKGYTLRVALATDDGLREALKLYDSEQYQVKKKIQTNVEESASKTYEQEIQELKDLEEKVKTVTAEEAVYLVNVGAIKSGASDIHFEPEEKEVRVRFRIDGLLHTVLHLQPASFANMANQIKYQCKMKLNIVNEPQDGRYSFTINKRKVDVRVSALPTQFGETFVCRLLDSTRHTMDFAAMGFTGSALAHVEHMKDMRSGMVLITGPTGSGKTTTLYGLLEKLNTQENKIITLEDPIEYHLEGISQSQINEKRGYDFASGLRTVLRQDPDIVMIGEIRDLETAEVCAEAALTGHVILSTLHTKSAIETIPRLLNMGLPAFMVAPVLDTVIAQRLARKFCPDCVEQKTVEKVKLDELQRMLESIKKIQPALNIEIPQILPAAKGCEACSHTGYRDRIALVEILDVDPEIRALIMEGSSSMKIIEAARRKGMLTMYEDGILKVVAGVTSLEEVHRVTAIAV